MRLVIQRVRRAAVRTEGRLLGEIGQGLLIFLGIADTDTEEMADRYIKKLSTLRIFEDADGKTNLSLADVQGEVLLVSQFTLYADCRKGNRPSFVRAGKPEFAEQMYEYFKAGCVEVFGHVACGMFGADMQVELENDGPFTILWDSDWW